MRPQICAAFDKVTGEPQQKRLMVYNCPVETYLGTLQPRSMVKCGLAWETNLRLKPPCRLGLLSLT